MKPARPVSGGLVYSTDGGRMCPQCRQPQATCRCAAAADAQRAATPQSACQVRVNLERQGRGGKTATVVRGVVLPEAEFSALGQRLRQACGSGGTAKDGLLVLQGDHVAKVMAALQAAGWSVKRSGG
jgi:translation initiation factor 1